MKIKKINLKDNNLQIQPPKKTSGFKKLEYQMSSDYMISIVEEYQDNGEINSIPTMLNHNFSILNQN